MRSRLFRPLYSRAASSTGGADVGINVLSGAPEKHLVRAVRIFKPAKVATQQGRGSSTHMWHVKFDKVSGNDRWTNPLMGWTSTSDPLSTLGMTFPTREAAVEYAERNGYEYKVSEPEEEKQAVRNIAPFARSMSHHWDHTGVPVYDNDK
eukprot:Plantae.Rhodophyta-Palmaria_palmata.ctg28576.p1 GENE.Plantae.Rhodophyta-Palmaria_palmata.ctg28576~~Plantae.Rhodophyta-Palmaria_palmata.ctg28576.p1  ORF type:complete len:174 (-),score=11.59 Plantae.Rhodophyta-Palmaria_palmata.ctg28576:172-621(-)